MFSTNWNWKKITKKEEETQIQQNHATANFALYFLFLYVFILLVRSKVVVHSFVDFTRLEITDVNRFGLTCYMIRNEKSTREKKQREIKITRMWVMAEVAKWNHWKLYTFCNVSHVNCGSRLSATRLRLIIRSKVKANNNFFWLKQFMVARAVISFPSRKI